MYNADKFSYNLRLMTILGKLMEVVAELTRKYIMENSQTAQNQDKYNAHHNALVERYEKLKAKSCSLQKQKEERLAKDEAEQVDFCLRISGDSMEPDFHDGDIVLVKGCPTINIGEIGIFVVNGSGYIKELGRNKLISLNDEYDDIRLTENDSVWCMGEVIGTLENDDFLD